MQKPVTAFLAALMAFGATYTVALAQQYGGYGSSGYNGNGNGRWRTQAWCGQNRYYRQRDRDDRRDDDGDRDDRERKDRDRDDRRYSPSYNASGNCASYGQQQNFQIRGAIVGVNGDQVTLQTQNFTTVTIDDRPALDNRKTGRVAIGRVVTAYGYWNGRVFYATQLV